MSTKNKPTQDANSEQNNPPNNPPPDANATVSAEAPGTDELRRLANENEQPAGEQPPPNIPRVPLVVVNDAHRALAAALVGGSLSALESFFPVRYRAETRAEGADVFAPVVAKHYDKMPLWYLQWQEEILAGTWAVKIATQTAKEIARVKAMEDEVRELAKEYRAGEGLSPKEARAKAIRELGYDELAGPQKAEKESAG